MFGDLDVLPGEPRNLAAVVHPTNITLTWSPPYPPIEIYRYELRILGLSEHYSILGNNHSFTARNLSAHTNYTFELTAVAPGGPGPSATLTVHTGEVGKLFLFL